MNLITKKIFIIFVSLFLCFLTYKFCYFIAEKFFFDKFFYQKSITYGYWDISKKISLSDYGQRSQDILSLQSGNKILHESDNNSYIIAIIGDSYVWGTGIKNNQRFSIILEKRLNNIRPTKIITLAEMGDSIIDYYSNYIKLIQQAKPNLLIFTLVDNDALPKSKQPLIPETQQIIANCQKQFPQNILTTNYNFTDNPEMYQMDSKAISQAYMNVGLEANKNPTNQCVMEKTISQLPNDNAIYFIPVHYYAISTDINDYYHTYINYLEKYQKYIITSEKMANSQKYGKYWKNGHDAYQSFHVSQAEGHPNALANQMYADILYQEITTNPKWGFIKK
jgi:hypothetical protein